MRECLCLRGTLAPCHKLLTDIDLDLDYIVPERDLFSQPTQHKCIQI